MERGWGKVNVLLKGGKIQEKIDTFDTAEKAQKEFTRICKEKSSKGYVEASKLKKESLIKIGCIKRWTIKVTKKSDK